MTSFLALALALQGAAVDPVPAVLKDISAPRIREKVERLVAFQTRNTFSETESDVRGIGAARRWIESELRASSAAAGGRLEVKTLSSTRKKKDGTEVEVVDVYGFLPGRVKDPLGRTYLVCGHYDSMAGKADDATSFAPGADDDASGTAVVLELARVMSSREFEANVVFLLVAGEEQGLWGSEAFAAFAEGEKLGLDGAITNDIIGAVEGGTGAKNEKVVRCFSGGDGLQDPAHEFARSLFDAAKRQSPDTEVHLVFRLDRLGRGGDHIPFHKRGVPAIRLVEANEHYDRQHKDVVEHVGDLPEYVSAEYSARVARLNAALLCDLALAPPAPTDVVLAGAHRYDTSLTWKPSAGAAGYVVVWRDTTSPTWQQRSAILHETTVVLPVIADDRFFGVRAVDALGHESRTSLPKQP
ncbi:MAG TPA: M20/M25/M40 family metallo-hydrolase [Thermoanaerobaculia bacterium]|nr:M20/M25/M40 family metallo-hydrolase [Thermoanaerobaculia bacterium]